MSPARSLTFWPTDLKDSSALVTVARGRFSLTGVDTAIRASPTSRSRSLAFFHWSSSASILPSRSLPAIRWRSRSSSLPAIGRTPVVLAHEMRVVVVEMGVVCLDGQRLQQHLVTDVCVGGRDPLGGRVDARRELTEVGRDVVEGARHDRVDTAVLVAHGLPECRGAEPPLSALTLPETVVVEDVPGGPELLDRLVDLILGQLDAVLLGNSRDPRD